MRRNAAFGVVAAFTGIVVALSAPTAVASAPQAPPTPTPSPTPPASLAALSADRLVQSQSARLFTSAKDEIHRLGVVSGHAGLQYVSYGRTHAGLPVYGGDFVVVTDATGRVLSTSVAQDRTLSVGTTPKISSAKAAEIARAQLKEVTDSTEPVLTVMAEGSGRLAYKVEVNGPNNRNPRIESRLHVYVDARTGAVAESSDLVKAGHGISHYHGQVTVGTTPVAGGYALNDPARPGLACGGQNGTHFTSPDDHWGDGTGTHLETACVDAMYAGAKEWDMLGAWLGRSGLDGAGGGFPARVGLADVSAYWTGSHISLGRSMDGQRHATAMDVVAHEFGHAIFQHTPGGATGSNEKDALNESAGDIFAALTEFYANEPATFDPPDYDVGEEFDVVGNGPIRRMHQPSLIPGHPDCYSPSVPNMDLYEASGVQNHWFYLLAAGSSPGGGLPDSPTCNGTSVTGIGIQKAGQVFMGALMRKTTTWTHSLARKASLEAALALYPNSCTEFDTVKAAWNAVSVPAEPDEPGPCTVRSEFSMSLSPTSATVQAGQFATTTVSTTTTLGLPQNVVFSATGAPAGATVAFAPPSVVSGASSTMTVTVPPGTTPGPYNMIVTGDGDGTGMDQTAPFTLTVTPMVSTVFDDTFETNLGWTVNPNGTDTAYSGQWSRGNPQGTSSGGVTLQLNNTVSGVNGLVTGASAGLSAGSNDIDGGVTTVQSPPITIPPGTSTLTFSWYLAHLNNSSSADYFRVRVISGAVNNVVFQQLGSSANRAGAWATATVNLTPYAGQTIRLRIDAADASGASLVEAGVDNVKVATP
ncbi:M4 family metallopeptidase [Rhizohabitans arisaemae]|uniref:M4 family metallopeptidase n=1 Tax=Rhizohabitans arisaemae TaxID=2720610 RepID=UPI0024B1C4F0|nr:M4 family metallopeptidase [Rhizohabitans arisaemae]